MEKNNNNLSPRDPFKNIKIFTAVLMLCAVATAIVLISLYDGGNRFSLFTRESAGRLTVSEWVLGAMLILFGFIVFMAASMLLPTVVKAITARFQNRLRARQLMGKDALIRTDPAAKLAYTGIVRFLGGDYQKAVVCFDKSLELDGIADDNKEFCFHWISECYHRLNDRKAYEETLLRCVTAVPSSVDANLDYGRLLMMVGRSEKAEYYFRQSLRYDPSCASGYYNLGEIELVRGNYTAAHGHYEMAQSLDTNNYYPLFENAVVYMLEGDIEAAEREYSRALAIDGDEELSGNEPAERLREKLGEIRDAREKLDEIRNTRQTIEEISRELAVNAPDTEITAEKEAVN